MPGHEVVGEVSPGLTVVAVAAARSREAAEPVCPSAYDARRPFLPVRQGGYRRACGYVDMQRKGADPGTRPTNHRARV
ncbi:hypothetical protein GCM10027290_28400 [Micromonospora sonneratiae]